MSTTDQRKFLLIQARNLGDAVISTAIVETVAQYPSEYKIDVLTRPEISPIFTQNKHVDRVFTARFPMGSLHDFGWDDALALMRMVAFLRRQGYTDVVNLQGDFREEFLGRLITRKRNWSPSWPQDHPYRQLVRPSFFPLANSPIPIRSDQPNVHEAVATMAKAMTSAPARKPALYTPAKEKLRWTPESQAVGLHPMASQACRRWELDKWKAVARRLIEAGIEVHVFGSPSEKAELTKYFGSLDTSKLILVTENLSTYFASVAQLRVLLCPDSLASHVAYALGVPTILLNGANDAEAWSPPGTAVLATGPGMPCYPCYNRPTCVGTAHEYGCVRRIQIKSVMETVREVLAGQDPITQSCYE